MRIFIDSDVIIASLLSSKGASSQLLRANNIEHCISSVSQQELQIVTKRLNIKDKLLRHVLKKLEVVKLPDTIEIIQEKFARYINDINDAHIVAGASAANARFLITYNVKDFIINTIKGDFDIVILTPGMFLQYLRSQE